MATVEFDGLGPEIDEARPTDAPPRLLVHASACDVHVMETHLDDPLALADRVAIASAPEILHEDEPTVTVAAIVEFLEGN